MIGSMQTDDERGGDARGPRREVAVADRADEFVQRIVVRHGFSTDMAGLMVADLRSSLDRPAARPPSHAATADDGVAFDHDAVAHVR
jgi:glutamate decarboxylase